jgi:hypothetical protein
MQQNEIKALVKTASTQDLLLIHAHSQEAITWSFKKSPTQQVFKQDFSCKCKHNLTFFIPSKDKALLQACKQETAQQLCPNCIKQRFKRLGINVTFYDLVATDVREKQKKLISRWLLLNDYLEGLMGLQRVKEAQPLMPLSEKSFADFSRDMFESFDTVLENDKNVSTEASVLLSNSAFSKIYPYLIASDLSQ